MPNKTIYVAEDDLPLFQRAQQLLGGNLSAAITRAVRRYVELEDGDLAAKQDIILTIGERGSQRPQKFAGRKLCVWRAPVKTVPGESLPTPEVFSVYHTARGQLAVHRRRSLDGFNYDDSTSARWADPQTWEDPEGFWNDSTEADLRVYPDIDHLATELPDELAARVRHTLNVPQVEVLDI